MSFEAISLRSPSPVPPRASSYQLNRMGAPQKPTLRQPSELDRLSQVKKSPVTAVARSSYVQPAQPHPSPVQMSPPPPDPLRGIGDDLIHQKNTSWSPEKETILLGPFDYLFGHPGKDIRAQLIAAFNAWLKVPEESLAVITKVVGMLHTASLL